MKLDFRKNLQEENLITKIDAKVKNIKKLPKLVGSKMLEEIFISNTQTNTLIIFINA